MTQTLVSAPSANKGVICIATNEDGTGYDIRFANRDEHTMKRGIYAKSLWGK